jgi:hypothetical protein
LQEAVKRKIKLMKKTSGIRKQHSSCCPKAQQANIQQERNQNILALFSLFQILYLNQKPLNTDVTSCISKSKQAANKRAELDQHQLDTESESP